MYIWEYPHKIWPDMVLYLSLRYLNGPLKWGYDGSSCAWIPSHDKVPRWRPPEGWLDVLRCRMLNAKADASAADLTGQFRQVIATCLSQHREAVVWAGEAWKAQLKGSLPYWQVLLEHEPRQNRSFEWAVAASSAAWVVLFLTWTCPPVCSVQRAPAQRWQFRRLNYFTSVRSRLTSSSNPIQWGYDQEAWWGGSSTSSHAGTYCNILLQSSWGDITDVVMEINTTPPWTFCWTQDRISGWFIRGGTWYHLELKHSCFRAHLIKQHVPGLELWYPGELWCYSLLFTWAQQGSYPAKDVAGSAISEKRRVQVSLCRVNWQNPQFLWLICIDMISMCVYHHFSGVNHAQSPFLPVKSPFCWAQNPAATAPGTFHLDHRHIGAQGIQRSTALGAKGGRVVARAAHAVAWRWWWKLHV